MRVSVESQWRRPSYPLNPLFSKNGRVKNGGVKNGEIHNKLYHLNTMQ